MTRQETEAIAVGVALVGIGVYLLVARQHNWWPFKPKEGQVPPAPTSPPNISQPTYDSSGKAKVSVSWQPVQGATYYQILVNGKVVVSNVQGTSYELTLDPGQTYQIAIAACS